MPAFGLSILWLHIYHLPRRSSLANPPLLFLKQILVMPVTNLQKCNFKFFVKKRCVLNEVVYGVLDMYIIIQNPPTIYTKPI